jgi:hypothetical protein
MKLSLAAAQREAGAVSLRNSKMKAIVRVCELTPTIKHWLPTREAKIVVAFLKEADLPTNLTLRISSTMVDDKPIAGPVALIC